MRHAELLALQPRLYLMAMPVAVPRYTVDDLYSSFPDDGNRYELLDGVLLVSPAPSFLHEIVVQRIRDQLSVYLGKSARVLTHGAVQIRPRTQLEPDLLVIPAAARVTRKTTWSDVRDWWLAVEVSGRGSRIYDRDAKQPAYPRLGVREAWRADLFDRCIEVTRRGEVGATRYDDRLTWQPPEMPEPLVIDIPAVFEDIEGDE
jgi:Uma2 family endonuclease